MNFDFGILILPSWAQPFLTKFFQTCVIWPIAIITWNYSIVFINLGMKLKFMGNMLSKIALSGCYSCSNQGNVSEKTPCRKA